jgi:hypothetical protein
MEKEPPYDNGKLTRTYEMVTKDKEGEAHRHILHVFDYNNPEATEYSFLSQASPITINYPEIKTRKSKEELIATFPDIHYGFRRLPDGTLRPTHNPEAIDLWLQIVEREKPTTVIIQGDGVDAAEVGKFDPDYNHYVDTLQLEIDGMHALICRIRASCPNSKIIYTRGNHCLRFQKNIIKNSMPLLGVRQGNLPESFAVNTLPFLLRLQELDIAYQDKYMATDDLIVTHGEFSTTRGSVAVKYLGFYATSCCYAHDHRVGYETRTFPNGKKISAFGFGCLADTTGSVPSYHSRIDDRGFLVPKNENWDSGAGFISISKKGFFRPEFVNLSEKEVSFNKRVYKARADVVEALSSGK